MPWAGNERGKTKVIRISRQLCSLQVIKDQKQPESVEYFIFYGSVTTNDTRCTREIKSKIVMVKAAFIEKTYFFTNKLNINLRKKLVNMLHLEHSLLWCRNFVRYIRNTWEVLQCGAGEGWKVTGRIL